MKIDLMDILNDYTDSDKEHQNDSSKKDSLENWTGRWMPSRPGEYTPPPKVFHKEEHPQDEVVEMGVKSVRCDDGKVAYIDIIFIKYLTNVLTNIVLSD